MNLGSRFVNYVQFLEGEFFYVFYCVGKIKNGLSSFLRDDYIMFRGFLFEEMNI